MKKIINLLLATIVILSSCSKEDDLLTPVPNPPTNITNTDTIVVTNGNNGTTTLEHTPNENLVIDNEFVNYTTADLEGTNWRVTSNSFYLNNRFPICPMPYDTIVGPNVWTNLGGEVYFSNQGDGYFKTRTYLMDCAPVYDIHGIAHYEPIYNYEPNPNNPDPLLKQDYVDYTVRDGEIIANVVQGQSQWHYTITLTIVKQTNNILILENNSHYDNPNTNAQGYPTYYDRNCRIELEKIN
tara:strand:+ start:101 stop:820 length:720 start_codon:yes stop_codon:yes gene_type:complete